MSDFSDEHDRMLVRLASAQLRQSNRIDWTKLCQRMTYTGKSQKQLQIRLKTLKRTYGCDINRFPRCFFAEATPNAPQRVDINVSRDNDGIPQELICRPLPGKASGQEARCAQHIGAWRAQRILLALQPPPQQADNLFAQSTKLSASELQMPVNLADLEQVDSNCDVTVQHQIDTHIQHAVDSDIIDMTDLLCDNAAPSVCIQMVDVHRAVAELYSLVPRHALVSSRHSPDHHPGEVTPNGLSAVLEAIPPMGATDTFLDIGSGIGNIVAQVALESRVGSCIGVEFQHNLAKISENIVQIARLKYPQMAPVTILQDDVRKLCTHSYVAVQDCTVLFSNNLVFEASSNEAVHAISVSTPSLQHVILMQRLCSRHRQDCRNAFCSIWKAERAIDVTVSWSQKKHVAYWYTRNTL
jgi:hypothetical protein